ncbi:MAG: carbonic anhydrase, partial [Chlamydiia bacterium]
MDKLVRGILEFRENHLKDYRTKFSHLAMGQAPDSLFITCSDSRVVPNLFTTTHPGHLFVVRNAGNIIPPYEIFSSERASIEFAIDQLPIENIIVCGHSNCGAMQARFLKKPDELSSSMQYWLAFSKEPKDCNCLEKLIKENVLLQMEHLMTYPMIREKVKKGLLKIWGWYFDVGTGDLYAWEERENNF